MKKIILFLSILMFCSSSQAEDLTKKIAETASSYISNLIPGEGTTEVSIDVRENYKPDFSILAVRELERSEDGNYFTQFSLFNTEKNNDERLVGNVGFGKRYLSDDKLSFTGVNLFLDADDNGNKRASIGGEAKNAMLEFTTNYYIGLDDGTDEKVLDGYDLRLASQIPYLHWAKGFIDTYSWDGRDRSDVEGTVIGSELLLSPNVNFEVAYDDKDRAGLDDEWYAKLMFFHPPKEGPTAQDGIAGTPWFSEKDMSNELLTKVKRNNKVFVEFSGSANIVRAD